MFGLRGKWFLFTVLAMAKKRNRFSNDAEQTRRVNGRHVHAKKDEDLRIASAVIQDIRKKHPDADREWFERACGDNAALSDVLKLVRAGAIK